MSNPPSQTTSFDSTTTSETMIQELAGGIETIARLVQELRASLHDSQVLTPHSEGYEDSIKRWSDAVERRAVCQTKHLV